MLRFAMYQRICCHGKFEIYEKYIHFDQIAGNGKLSENWRYVEFEKNYEDIINFTDEKTTKWRGKCFIEK